MWKSFSDWNVSLTFALLSPCEVAGFCQSWSVPGPSCRSICSFKGFLRFNVGHSCTGAMKILLTLSPCSGPKLSLMYQQEHLPYTSIATLFCCYEHMSDGLKVQNIMVGRPGCSSSVVVGGCDSDFFTSCREDTKRLQALKPQGPLPVTHFL